MTTVYIFAVPTTTPVWLNESVSCSTAGCSASATFDLNGWVTWTALHLSIKNLIGDFASSTEYADVYVGGSDIGVDCSSGNDCLSTYTCLTDFDISSYVSSGASSVTITLDASMRVDECTPMMSADIILIMLGATEATPTPTLTPIPTGGKHIGKNTVQAFLFAYWCRKELDRALYISV